MNSNELWYNNCHILTVSLNDQYNIICIHYKNNRPLCLQRLYKVFCLINNSGTHWGNCILTNFVENVQLWSILIISCLGEPTLPSKFVTINHYLYINIEFEFFLLNLKFLLLSPSLTSTSTKTIQFVTL